MPDVRKSYEMRRLSEVRARWDQRAASWERDLSDENSPVNAEGAYSRFLEFAGEELESVRGGGGCALDLGSGTGRVSSALSRGDLSWVLLDVSAAMLRHRTSEKPACGAVQGDGFHLPFRSSSLVAVVSRGVLLSHYGRLNANLLLNEVFRVLRPGGLVVLDFLTNRALSIAAVPEYKWLATDEEVTVQLEATGLEVRRVESRLVRSHFLSARKVAPKR